MKNATDIIREELHFPSIQRFQAAWNLGDPLKVDGIVGEKTREAAITSWKRHEEGRPDISDHFSVHEFWCKCHGKYHGCSYILVSRGLLSSLEKMRTTYYKTGLTIVSGYRCPTQNERVGGAKGSMHVKGLAADIHGVVGYKSLETHHWFAGYGIASNKTVVHVDRRDLVDMASLTRPTRWYY